MLCKQVHADFTWVRFENQISLKIPSNTCNGWNLFMTVAIVPVLIQWLKHLFTTEHISSNTSFTTTTLVHNTIYKFLSHSALKAWFWLDRRCRFIFHRSCSDSNSGCKFYITALIIVSIETIYTGIYTVWWTSHKQIREFWKESPMSVLCNSQR